MTSPLACPVALSSPPWNLASRGGYREIRTPNHLPLQSAVSRISSARLDSISSQLSPTGHAVLGFVARTRLCSGAQLERLFWTEGEPDSRARQARRALRRLADWRILDRQPRAIGGRRAGSRGYIYSLGPAGVRLLDRESGGRVRRLGVPGDRFVAHVLSCTELMVRVQEAARRGDLDVIEIHSEPECWRSFPSSFGARQVCKPDLFARIGAGTLEDRWFVEVDMATEASGTLTAKFKRYLAHYRSGREQHAHGIYPRVLWAVPHGRRAVQVGEVLRRQPVETQRLFTVCLLDEVMERMSAEASS
jgi:Replication-relaxation